MMTNAKDKLRKIFAVFTVMIATSCITVNVNFPETAVRRAADDFVKDLYDRQAAQSKETKGKNKSSPSSPSQKKDTDGTMLLDLLISPAYALEADVSLNGSQYDKHKDSMGRRLVKLDANTANGTIKEESDGLVSTNSNDAEIKALVKAENADRLKVFELYQKEKGFNDRQMDKIRSLFSESFKNRSKMR